MSSSLRSSWSRQLNNKAEGGNCLNRIIRGRFELSWKKLGTSFGGRIRKSFSGSSKLFPSLARAGCFARQKKSRKTDGKTLCGAYHIFLLIWSINFNPQQSPLGEIKFNFFFSPPTPRLRRSKLKAFPAVSLPNERHDNEENTKLNLIVFSGADKPLA